MVLAILDIEHLINLVKNYPEILNFITRVKPIIFKDGKDKYCCLSGRNALELIYGYGPTHETAFDDWLQCWQKRYPDEPLARPQ